MRGNVNPDGFRRVVRALRKQWAVCPMCGRTVLTFTHLNDGSRVYRSHETRRGEKCDQSGELVIDHPED